MKQDFRQFALKAHRLRAKGIGYPQIAAKLKLADNDAAFAMVRAGDKIAWAEYCRLTPDERLVMMTLSRMEARLIETDSPCAKTKHVDFAAGQRSGWCAKVVDKRLRMLRDGEAEPNQVRDRLNLVYHSKLDKSIWLTAPGWALVWEAGYVLKNWKVPA